MQSGPSVDPVTGRPRQASQHSDEALYEKAEWIGVDDSVAADRLRDMVESLLISRIQELILNDSKAEGYMSILREMGYRRQAAERAAQALTKPRQHQSGRSK